VGGYLPEYESGIQSKRAKRVPVYKQQVNPIKLGGYAPEKGAQTGGDLKVGGYAPEFGAAALKKTPKPLPKPLFCPFLGGYPPE
jgi:hypothetical protein